MNWITLKDVEELNAIKKTSTEEPCIIFKHSTRCPD
jgi:bacillithiol system protein YtxJ